MAYSYHRRRKSMAATSQDAKSAQILGNTSPFLHPPSRQMLGFPLPDGDGFPLHAVGMLCFSRQWQFWCRGHAHCITTPFTLSHSYPWLLLCNFFFVCFCFSCVILFGLPHASVAESERLSSQHMPLQVVLFLPFSSKGQRSIHQH